MSYNNQQHPKMCLRLSKNPEGDNSENRQKSFQYGLDRARKINLAFPPNLDFDDFWEGHFDNPAYKNFSGETKKIFLGGLNRLKGNHRRFECASWEGDVVTSLALGAYKQGESNLVLQYFAIHKALDANTLDALFFAIHAYMIYTAGRSSKLLFMNNPDLSSSETRRAEQYYELYRPRYELITG
ncbi:hypothetical protein ACJJIF_05870 [Microbulbifer sp. SSSA002]|uniref:hypothetical protein n=1 Tax=unclassified Microbulbifer TaxID=2619833 RepID=UPI00403A1D2F